MAHIDNADLSVFQDVCGLHDFTPEQLEYIRKMALGLKVILEDSKNANNNAWPKQGASRNLDIQDTHFSHFRKPSRNHFRNCSVIRIDLPAFQRIRTDRFAEPLDRPVPHRM